MKEKTKELLRVVLICLATFLGVMMLIMFFVSMIAAEIMVIVILSLVLIYCVFIFILLCIHSKDDKALKFFFTSLIIATAFNIYWIASDLYTYQIMKTPDDSLEAMHSPLSIFGSIFVGYFLIVGAFAVFYWATHYRWSWDQGDSDRNNTTNIYITQEIINKSKDSDNNK